MALLATVLYMVAALQRPPLATSWSWTRHTARRSSPSIAQLRSNRSPSTGLELGVNTAKEYLFETTVARPLGLQLEERDGDGVVVVLVYDGGNAALAGIEAGDRIVATSASVGDAMWEKRTLDGVLAAIQTRVDGKVRLRVARDSAAGRRQRLAAWEVPHTHEYEVELSQPLGLTLRQAYAPNATAPSADMGAGPGDGGHDASSTWVEVSHVEPGSAAALCGFIRAGDVVVATSASVGPSMWEKRSLEGVLSAISTRLFTSPTVTLRFRRTRLIGPWASELVQIARGERTALSREALASYRRDRRESRGGAALSESAAAAVRELCAPALARFGRQSARRHEQGPSERSVDEVFGAAESVKQVAAASTAAQVAGEALAGAGDAPRTSANAADGSAGTARPVFDGVGEVAALDDDDAQRGTLGATVAGGGAVGSSAAAVADEAITSKARAALAGGAVGDVGAEASIAEPTDAGGAAEAALDDDSAILAAHAASLERASAEADVRKRYSGRQLASRTEVAAALASEAAVAYREGGGRELAALLAMWRRLRLSPVPLDARLTNSFMSAALRCGAPRLARALFYDATSPAAEAVVVRPRGAAPIVQPETSVYNTLIKAHGVAGERAEAEAVLQRMRAEGVPPDAYTLNTLMSVCAKAADRQGMLRYFRALEEAGLAPTIDSWNVVLDFCARGRQPAQARDVLRRMRAAGIKPDAVSYACMIQAHVRSGEAAGGGVDAAARVLDEALGAKVELDAPAFNALLGGYATQLRWADAVALLRSMRSHDVRPNQLSYSLVLRACVRARAADQAATVHDMMLEDGLPATVRSFSMVLSAYANGGQVREALDLLRRMQAEGVPPNRYTFSSMMEACVNGGQPETALAVFEQMTAQGISPDVVSYTLLVRAHATPQTSRADHVPEADLRAAFGLLQRMAAEGVPPNVVTYNALLSGCLLPAAPGGEPRYATALTAVREMLFSRVSPTKRTFLILAATPRQRAAPRAGGRAGSRGRGARGDMDVREQAPLTAARLEYFTKLISEFRAARRQLDGEIYLEILRSAAVAAAAIGAREGAPAATRSDGRTSAPGSISRKLAEGWIQLGLEALTERRGGSADGRPALFNPRKVHALQEGPLEAAIEAAAPDSYAANDVRVAVEKS